MLLDAPAQKNTIFKNGIKLFRCQINHVFKNRIYFLFIFKNVFFLDLSKILDKCHEICYNIQKPSFPK